MSLKIEINTETACRIEATGGVDDIAAELLLGVAEIYSSFLRHDARLAAVFKAMMQAGISRNDSPTWNGKMRGEAASYVFAKIPKKDGR